MSETNGVNGSKERPATDKPWRFQAGNPGRPKGTQNIQKLLANALKAAEKKRAELHEPCACVTSGKLATAFTQKELYAQSCKTLDEHFARRAFLDDDVLAVFQRKRIPDIKSDEESSERALVIQVISYGAIPAQVSIV